MSIFKHHAMNMCEGLDIRLLVFLTSALDCGD
jgi:hypothetical protein